MAFCSVNSVPGYLWLCSLTATQGGKKETIATMLLRNNTQIGIISVACKNISEIMQFIVMLVYFLPAGSFAQICAYTCGYYIYY